MHVGENIRILLIEDNESDAELIVRQLSSSGLSSQKVISTLKESLAWIVENETDVVLLDLGLPDSSGLETFEKLYAETLAPIVVLTGSHDSEMALRGMLWGAQDWLVKDQHGMANLGQAVLYAVLRGEKRREYRKLESVFMNGEKRLATALRNLGINGWRTDNAR